MKHIIHLFPAYKIGGAPVCILRFIESTKNRFRHTTIASLEDKGFFEQFANHTNGNSFDVDLTSFSIRSFCSVLKIIRKAKPQVVHVHGKGGALYGFLASLVLFKPFKLFHTFHGFYKCWNGYKWGAYLIFEKIFSFLYDKGIAVSESERNYYLESIGIRHDKVVMIPNGVYIRNELLPFDIFKSQSSCSFNIVTLSRISHQKDLVTMLESFDILRKQTSVALHIFGGVLESDITYQQEILSLIQKLHLSGHVYLWGDVSSAGNLIHNYDLYWSTSKFEGLPTAVIEAFLSKTLVVGTDCRGNIDLIDDGVTGILTKIGSVESNVSGIKKAIDLIARKQQYDILSNAFNKGLKYSMAKNVENLSKLYHA